MEYIAFRVGEQEFVMDASRVRGLVPAYAVIPMETEKPWMLGFASLRGHDLPVIDLRAKLDLARGTRGRLPCVIAVETKLPLGPRLIGFIADRVSRIVALGPDDIRDGAARISGKARKVFDPDTIVSGEELAVIL